MRGMIKASIIANGRKEVAQKVEKLATKRSKGRRCPHRSDQLPSGIP
jgi:hypothetical protein